jgi:hypothetical protein
MSAINPSLRPYLLPAAMLLACLSLFGAWTRFARPIHHYQSCYTLGFENLDEKKVFPLQGAELSRLAQRAISADLMKRFPKETPGLKTELLAGDGHSFCLKVRFSGMNPDELLPEEFRNVFEAQIRELPVQRHPRLVTISESLQTRHASVGGLVLLVALTSILGWLLSRLSSKPL